jgi:surfeit locus 1 family protein
LRVIEISRAGIIGSILALAVIILCVRFGFWQLDRRAQRAALNDAVAARMALPPVPLAPGTRDSTGLLYRRVLVSGSPDHERALVWTARSYRGAPGVHLMVPLRTPGRDPALLVDRGFVPSADAHSVTVADFPAPEPLQAEGIVLPLPDEPWRRAGGGAGRTFQHLARLPLEEQLPYSLAPFYVQAATPTASVDGWPRPVPLPALDPGPHLSYAVQWFGFATVALVGWIVLLVRGSGWERTPPASGGRAADSRISPAAPPD